MTFPFDMSNQEILEKAIQKAIDGGWHLVTNGGFYLVNGEVKFEVGFIDLPRFPIERIIFNHDFAKALWGEGKHWLVKGWPEEAKARLIKLEGHKYVKTDWQHHLQQMVIADEPIRYLGDNI